MPQFASIARCLSLAGAVLPLALAASAADAQQFTIARDISCSADGG